MQTVRQHNKVRTLSGKDLGGRFMVMCDDCNTCAHAYTEEEAAKDLKNTSCSQDCSNCKALRHSHDKKPAVPVNGSCNDLLHVCPRDGNRWWQTNGHFHLWQQVTSDKEWEDLKKPQRADD